MNARFLVITGMVLTAAAARLIPHPPNFTPIAAMALFGGACVSRNWLAFLVPLGAMTLSDLVIYHSHSPRPELGDYAGHRLAVYGCFSVMVCVGFWLRSRRTVLPIFGAALACSVFFFVVTNFVVWLRPGDGLGREQNLTGLLLCYIDAIPFFYNTVLGDLFYSGILFGAFALLEHWLPALRESAITAVGQKEYATVDR
jgi:hypothetical protein